MQQVKSPWGNRFFFDLFKTGYASPFYQLPIRNRLTDDILFDENNEINEQKFDDVSVIWDIPEYLEVNLKQLGPHVKVSKIRQYKGYLMDLSPFKNLDGFLAKQLSSRNRKKLRSKTRKLESEHDIRYAFYFGNVEKEEYHRLFDTFYDFLEERFEEKKTVNNNLGKWDFYRDLVYPMILEKRASLFVIYDGDKPVTIGMQFHLSRTVFSYVQSYDIAYSQYNMGDISTMKRLEWCFEQGFDILDLSMGETDYKLKWCNHQYDLYFHVFHNSKSVAAVFKSRVRISKLTFKQYLRDKDILGKLFKLDKFKYWIRNLSS